MEGILKGRVALVTGGSSGIGRASALAFAREAAKVVVSDIDVDGGLKTVRMIKETGGESVFVKADVSNAAEVEALVDRAVETYGQLDCALNNAGITGTTASIVECTEENWNFIMNTSLKSVWLCMKFEIKHMEKRGGGAIVNTASIGGLVGHPKNPVYVASKHGVVGLTKAAALEYAKAGIRINAVCPGPILTPLSENIDSKDPRHEAETIAGIPLGRRGTPDEVAQASVWLCSDAASFVIGHTMVIDGGWIAQ